MVNLEEAYERRPRTCLFCGKEFEDDPEPYPEGLTAEMKEGIHRAREHVESEISNTPEKQKKGNMIEEKWRAEA